MMQRRSRLSAMSYSGRVWIVVAALLLWNLSCFKYAEAQKEVLTQKQIVAQYRMDEDFTTCQDQNRDFLNSAEYTCKSCSGNLIPDFGDIYPLDGLGNAQACRCPVGYRVDELDCSGDPSGECESISCYSCGRFLGQAAYQDQSACVGCDPDTTNGYDSSIGDCSCRSTQFALVEESIVGEKGLNKTCVQCPTGTAVVNRNRNIAGRDYTADLYTCARCPDAHMQMSVIDGTYRCTCETGYTLMGLSAIGEQSCVLSTLANRYNGDKSQAKKVTYYQGVSKTLDSLTFEHYFHKAATLCYYSGRPSDILHCQQLANLCVLALYDNTHPACIAHQDVISERDAVDDVTNWAIGQPWLYYGGTGNDACLQDIFKSRTTFEGFYQQFMLATYYMNGTLKGYDDLETTLAYCSNLAPRSHKGGGPGSDTRWQIIGTNYRKNYTCNLDSLLSDGEQLFYEAFAWHTKKSRFSPLPVRILNLRVDGGTPNKRYSSATLCDEGDVEVRRFFLVDKVSGITDQLKAGDYPEVVRYARYISIEASLAAPARFYPPVITIQYNENDTSSWDDATTTSYEFSMYYTQDTTNYDLQFNAIWITVMVFTGLWFALRVYNWRTRNARVISEQHLSTELGVLNFEAIFEILLLMISTWNFVFFWFTIMICWYFFAYYKIVTIPVTLPPPDINIFSESSPYYKLVVNIHVMAFFQLFYILVIIFRQSRADVFFIDWEPARSRSGVASSAATAGAGGKGTQQHQVSVWRTILVANEWAELQTLRKTDIRFTLIFLAFIMIGLREQNNATHQPVLDDKSDGDHNTAFRFGNAGFYWLLLSFGQYAWKFFIAERYLGEPPERLFIDFCTLAKVSVIVLDEKFHGYYLHCRSPHQYADGNMTELVQMLHKEEAGLTTDRSLEGAPQDVQSFQIFVSGEWRTAFDKIKVNITGAESMTEMLQIGRNRGLMSQSAAAAARARGIGLPSAAAGSSAAASAAAAGRRGYVNNVPPERVLKAWKEMLVFLQEFIDNNFGKAGLKRTVREPTYWEKLLNMGPQLVTSDTPSIFLTDREFQYTKTMFLGRETELLLLNILTYSVVDLWFNDTATSILLTYLLDLGIVQLRHSWGERAISKQTLIDSRFLI